MKNRAHLEQARRMSLQHGDKLFIFIFNPVAGG